MRSCSRKYTQEQKGTKQFRKNNDGAQIYIKILKTTYCSLYISVGDND